MSEFGGLDFYVGSVRGVRAFDVDSLGRLRGVTHAHIWTPGENTSMHASAPDWSGQVLRNARLTFAGGSYSVTTAAPVFDEPQPATRPQHDFKTCQSCGFYAYYEDESTYASPGRVSGVVEGYGTVHLGSNGFRAEKARVVALLAEHPEVDSDVASKFRWRLDTLARRSGEGDWLLAPAFVSVGAPVVGGGSLMTLSVVAGAFVMAVLGLAAAYFFYSASRAFSYYLDRRYPSVSRRTQRNPFEAEAEPSVVEKLRRNYPDVPIYTSRKAMLRDFPTDPPREITPETADDFWTRSA